MAARNIRARAQPPNSSQASIWANPIYVKQKNDLMEAQLDESRSKAELNRAQTWAATEKAKFWERANAELNNKNLILIMQSDTRLNSCVNKDHAVSCFALLIKTVNFGSLTR